MMNKKGRVENTRRLRARRRKAGICLSCTEPAEEGRSLCLYHRYKHKCMQVINQRKHTSNGLCKQCSSPKLPDSIFCEGCREKRRATNRNAHRKKRGIPLDAPLYNQTEVKLKANPWLED